MQLGVYEALCSAADGVRKTFFDASENGDRSPGLVSGRSERDESTRPGFPSAHSANRDPQQSRTRFAFVGVVVLMSNLTWSSASASPGATYLCNNSG